LFFDHVFLVDRWARDVRVSIKDGVIIDVEVGARPDGARRVAGAALPGLPNLHCHAFQRAIAGRAERRGSGDDSFWTWRDMMYRFVGRLSPDDVQAIAAYAYLEMLERGFTAVGEFHYLHHDPSGLPYADLGETASRIAAAVAETGIGLTLLPAFYAHGGFGGAAPTPGQRRFLNSPDRFLQLLDRSREILAALPTATLGVAPHSLRAVTAESLRVVLEATTTEPIHMHAAEQTKEVDDCLSWSGRRPVEWLLDHMGVDSRWCLIHATHMTGNETQRLAQSGAVAGLCPLTEASLGDGIFNGADYLAAGGRFGVGTDSNIEIAAAGELRQLEYSQRLRDHARNVLTRARGESTGERILKETLAGGAQALARPIGAIEVGRRADIVVLDPEWTELEVSHSDHLIDSWIFAPRPSAVRTVYIGGEQIVDEGRHRDRETISARYRTVVARLMSDD
jgi:formiminoglutamate deiminase